MKRERSIFLKNWLHSGARKPLVIRGARQVGKTWLVRDLAKTEKLQLVELNFERRPELESLFASNEPKEILSHLRAFTGKAIDPLETLLFLDEIQSAPHLLAKLRWFAEDMPELPVIVAGSLLDFALEEHEFSMPVGRIGYMYLEPLSFEEFLEALGNSNLVDYLRGFSLKDQIPSALHQQLMQHMKEYLVIGGMPAAVSAWRTSQSLENVSQIHLDLLATYRDDFTKYHRRLTLGRLEEVMASVPKQLGKKFVYRHANPDALTLPLKQALDLLVKARVCHRVLATTANGLPLEAEIHEKHFKAILLDCGLCGASLGLSLQQLQSVSELSMINSGGMAEQLVGQQLRTLFPAYHSPALYYWQRSEKTGNAEVDYVMQHQNRVIPLEVKAGSRGALRSLHEYMKRKKGELAVRVNSDFPSICPVHVKDAFGTPIEYTLLSIPFYLVGQLHRLLES